MTASWTPAALAAAATMLDRIDAKLSAETHVVVSARGKLSRAKLVKEVTAEFNCTAQPDEGALSFLCPRGVLQAVATRLREAGADVVTVTSAEYIFHAKNALMDRLRKRLKK